MSFVILSTGTLTGSTLHTLKMRTIVCVIAVAMLAILAGGVAVGYQIGQASYPAMLGGWSGAEHAQPLEPDTPESRVLIDRVGALSGRLIRLETEAVSLARKVGVVSVAGQGRDRPTAGTARVEQGDSAEAPADSDEPSGGPFVSAGGFTVLGLLNLPDFDVAERLSQLALDLDRIEATFARVARVTAVHDLEIMAFPSRPPLDSDTITSGFGIRRDPFTHRLARHTGLDFRAPYGTPILASAGGRVRLSGYRGAYGNSIEIDHGDGLATRYGHASRLFVRPGEIVLPGQRIAAVGSTGRSTGPHLHFEVLRNGTPVDPRLYLARDGS